MNSAALSSYIKSAAKQAGFSFCGIARAVFLNDDARRLERWLQNGYQGEMKYMERHFDLRTDPQKLVPGARSVITFLHNYYPAQDQEANKPKIAKYAWGKDYHDVIRAKLNQLLTDLKKTAGDFQGRGFVDSAPVLEKSWAQRSGLGWIGKNGNLINKSSGSFYFIATLITDLELAYDDPFARDYCGSCTRCIDACPTNAILPDKVIDGSRCISYYTIELKKMALPDDIKGKTENWIFGCDTCQDVCPWNRFSQPHTEPAFHPLPELLNMKKEDWQQLTEEKFKSLFRNSPLSRPGYQGLMRNLTLLSSESADGG